SSISSLIDLHQIHEIALLASHTSSDPPSFNSSLGNSPTPAVSESSNSPRSSACSSPSRTPSVKFAPFPQIDPINRKRSLAPLGVSARSRRKRVTPGEPQLSLWIEVPDETMEDPLITFGKFLKHASQNLWRRVRKKSTAAPQKGDDSQTVEPVIEIKAGNGSDALAPR
ncbi:hypothetical protein BU15DRAFT_24427, partial [Melanogaster broomeanus]